MRKNNEKNITPSEQFHHSKIIETEEQTHNKTATFYCIDCTRLGG
jgi:hypothetical protein